VKQLLRVSHLLLVTFRHLLKPGFLDAPQDGDKIEKKKQFPQPILTAESVCVLQVYTSLCKSSCSEDQVCYIYGHISNKNGLSAKDKTYSSLTI
jgi:hypothetical protein